MNIIEENLEKALDGEFFSSISEEYFFKTRLRNLSERKLKSIRSNLFKEKVVEFTLKDDEIREVLRIGDKGDYTRSLVVFDIENGETDILSSSPDGDDENNNLPLLYLDYLFEEFEDINYKLKPPKVSVVLPNFFKRTFTFRTKYQFKDVDRFLNQLISNWIKKNKNEIKENSKDYLWKNIEDFLVSRNVLTNPDFEGFFGAKRFLLAYSEMDVVYDHNELIYYLNKLLDFIEKYEEEIDFKTFKVIISGELFQQFYSELNDPYEYKFKRSKGTVKLLKRIRNTRKKLKRNNN